MESGVHPKYLNALDEIIYDGLNKKWSTVDATGWKCSLMHVAHAFYFKRDVGGESTTINNTVLTFDCASIDYLNGIGKEAPEYDVGVEEDTTFFAVGNGKLLHKHHKMGENIFDDYGGEGPRDEEFQAVYLHTAIIIRK